MTQPAYIHKFSRNEFIFVGTVVGYTHYPAKPVSSNQNTKKWPQVITLDEGGVLVEETAYVFKPENSGSRYEIVDALSSCGGLGSSFDEMKRIFPVGAKVAVVGYKRQNEVRQKNSIPLYISPALGVFRSYREEEELDVSLTSAIKLDPEGSYSYGTLFALRKELFKIDTEISEQKRYEKLKQLIFLMPDDTPINFVKLLRTYIQNHALHSQLTDLYVRKLKNKGLSNDQIKSHLHIMNVLY